MKNFLRSTLPGSRPVLLQGAGIELALTWYPQFLHGGRFLWQFVRALLRNFDLSGPPVPQALQQSGTMICQVLAMIDAAMGALPWANLRTCQGKLRFQLQPAELALLSETLSFLEGRGATASLGRSLGLKVHMLLLRVL
eukprot:Skav212683  [mRNA]  locus=scaffold1930:82690:83106:- [translate_table: standard]